MKCSVIAIFMASSMLFLQGCIILPWYEVSDHSRRNMSKQQFQSIQVGKATRLDLLLRFGEPDGINEDETKMYYRVSHDVLIGASEGGDAPLVQSHKFYKLEFDPKGIVSKKELSKDLDWVF